MTMMLNGLGSKIVFNSWIIYVYIVVTWRLYLYKSLLCLLEGDRKHKHIDGGDVRGLSVAHFCPFLPPKGV